MQSNNEKNDKSFQEDPAHAQCCKGALLLPEKKWTLFHMGWFTMFVQ